MNLATSGGFAGSAWNADPWAGASVAPSNFLPLPSARGSTLEAVPGALDPGMTLMARVAGDPDPSASEASAPAVVPDDIPTPDPGWSVIEGG